MPKPRVKIYDQDLMREVSGPMATIRTCLLCKHAEVVRKAPKGFGLAGGHGRGYGFREGNKARGRMFDHYKEKHPERYAELLEQARQRAKVA